MIEGSAVQFLPIADALDAEALADAQDVEIAVAPTEGAVRTRFLRAEHIMATALKVGRPKDSNRIIQFVEAGCFDQAMLCDIIERNELQSRWRNFVTRFDIEDFCAPKRGQ